MPREIIASGHSGTFVQSEYVNAHYLRYLFDFKSKTKVNAHSNMVLMGLGMGLFSMLMAPVSAEVRVYQPNVSQSQISVPRDIKPAEPVQPAMGAPRASSPAVATTQVSDSAYVAALQMIQPKLYKLGSARVFIRADDLSTEMVERLKELKALEDLHSEVYFQDVKVEDLVKLFGEKLKDYPKDMEFNVDMNGTLAAELQVKGKNVIVYTSPQGKVSQFELNSAYAFRTAIEQIKAAPAAK